LPQNVAAKHTVEASPQITMHYQQLPVTAAIAIRQCTDFAPEHHEQ
jgi:hypothetical protein